MRAAANSRPAGECIDEPREHTERLLVAGAPALWSGVISQDSRLRMAKPPECQGARCQAHGISESPAERSHS